MADRTRVTAHDDGAEEALMGTAASTVTAHQVIEDWYASRAPRDPYNDLGVLISEIKRLRGSLSEIRGLATAAYTPKQADGALDRIVRVVNEAESDG